MTRSSGRPSLHAFPTRRSSDLDLLVERLAFAVAAPVGQGLVKLLSQVAQYGVAFELRRAAALDGRLMLFVLALVGKQRYRQAHADAGQVRVLQPEAIAGLDGPFRLVGQIGRAHV